jgi:hypothetical protein
VGAQNSAASLAAGGRHDAGAMLEYLLLLVAPIRAVVRDRHELVAGNRLLRQQLAVPACPTRKPSRLRIGDRLFWIAVRRRWLDRRRHPVVTARTTSSATRPAVASMSSPVPSGAPQVI